MKFSFIPLIALMGLTILVSGCDDDINSYAVPLKTAENSRSEFFIVVGDIQEYTYNQGYYPYLEATVNWINYQITHQLPVTNVLFTGDITMTNEPNHWNGFFRLASPLAEKVPVTVCTGNHDYDWIDGKIYDRYSSRLNEYAVFPSTEKRLVSAYDEGKWENVILENYIHGERYDLIVLEFGPRTEVVEWARQHVEAHPENHYILFTHEFLSREGERVVDESWAQWQFEGTGGTWSSPEDVWRELVYPNDNVSFVLCGHNGFCRHLASTNAAGREVMQILFNVQYQEHGGDGWLQVWEIPESSDSISVKTSNAVTGETLTDPQASFTFRYR